MQTCFSNLTPFSGQANELGYISVVHYKYDILIKMNVEFKLFKIFNRKYH